MNNNILKGNIVEKVEDCKLVKNGYEDNGHDCWGNLEYTTYKYVFINGKKENVHDGWYIVHNGTEVLDTMTEDFYNWKNDQLTKDNLKNYIT